MGSFDPTKQWMHLLDETVLAENPAGRSLSPEVIPHEESDLHRVFCDEHFCLERNVGEQGGERSVHGHSPGPEMRIDGEVQPRTKGR